MTAYARERIVDDLKAHFLAALLILTAILLRAAVAT